MERIKKIINSFDTGAICAIQLFRELLCERNLFGDISDPIFQKITGLESQTDHLLIQGRNLESKISDSDIKFYDDAARELVNEINRRLIS